jgi:L-lactate dehydrogenase complex protein LldE
MRIAQHIPCIVDQWMPEVGISKVRVLERLGHTVTFNAAQTCCGRPAFDSGLIADARAIARRNLAIFADAEYIVTPSASCAAMMKREYPTMLSDPAESHEARLIVERASEFGHFLVHTLKVEDVGARYPESVAIQECCNTGRAGATPGEMRRLLSKVTGLTIVDEPVRDCCGFGGPFSLQFPGLSTAMGTLRADSVIKAAARCYVSNDPGCLLQLRGIMGRRAKPIRGLHLAEVLAAV